MSGDLRAGLWVVGVVLAMAACAGGAAGVALPDLQGRRHEPLEVAAGDVHVVVFTSHECPIANAYAPTLRRLASSWQGKPVRLFVVYVSDVDRVAAAAHAREYQLPGTVLGDPRHELAAALGATRTPEAVVLTDAGVVYRGRIDDQWQALGSRAPNAVMHDLHDAVAAALDGLRLPGPFPEAVGCLLPEPSGRW
ncbi:MAG: redoxin domain-containing protein [Planctomycetes bacterium]|nr:redoxin domain-containing protein [Planctomycetota bacterium]